MDTKIQDRYFTPLAVLAGAIIIGLAIFFGRGVAPIKPTTGQSSATHPVENAQIVNTKDIKTADNPYIGNKDAPVTLIEWFDYQCPYCKLFEQNTESKLYKNYVQTGKLKIVFKDFVFLGPDSKTAALFARAVWATYPNKFYEWYQAVFSAQDKENSGFGNLSSIVTLTKKIPGMDTDVIVARMNKDKSQFEAAISADGLEGRAIGIKGTPSMVIGKYLIVGAQPYSKVQSLIESQLQAKK